MKSQHELSYPIGTFAAIPSPSANIIADWQQIIADFPNQLRTATSGLSSQELAYHYRPGGWTIRQVVHHCADSHMNAFIRFKLALTEDKPSIKPYNEAAWAEMADYHLPIEISLAILEGIHTRWVALLNGMKEDQYQCSFFHPEHGAPFSLLLGLDNYQWHCRHHLAHVKQAKALKF
ncbi:MAG: YfiT family bacillithiol transferase [Lewinella sp.]|uniref:YfiT family bacillithiol transferase n=1 Tax=Lewinella sp. TaxID=2004506 RepID=UPI003D6BF38E